MSGGYGIVCKWYAYRKQTPMPSYLVANGRPANGGFCGLSFVAPVGLLLSCNHIYNQYVFIDNSDETLQKFEKTAHNMHSLSRYSRQNAINKEWIDEYLNEAHSQGLQAVRAHFNVLAWGEDMEEKYIRKKPPQIQGVAISYYCVIFSNRKFSSINLCSFVSNFLLFWRRVSNK